MHSRYILALKTAFGIEGEDNPTALPKRLMEILGEIETDLKPMATGASITSTEIALAIQMFRLEKRLLENGVNLQRPARDYETTTPKAGTIGAVRAARPIAPSTKKVAAAQPTKPQLQRK